MKFSGVITMDKRDFHAQGQGQMSKVKVTEFKANFAPIWAFPDHNSIWIYSCLWNDAYSLK